MQRPEGCVTLVNSDRICALGGTVGKSKRVKDDAEKRKGPDHMGASNWGALSDNQGAGKNENI